MNLLTDLLTLQNQLKIFHWQTKSYAQHVAFGGAHDDLISLIDEFIEVFQGKYGRIKAKDVFVIELHNLKEDYKNSINTNIEYLTNDVPKALSTKDTDLLNIRDEMLSVLNKLKYLLTLE